MPEGITTLSIILLVCTIAIALSNALTAYAIYWERKTKTAPPYLGFRVATNEVNQPEFIVENPSERLYQIVKIQFIGNLKIHNFETQNHKFRIRSNDKILYVEKLKPGDFISGHLDLNNPNKAYPFFVKFRISTYPGEKNIVNRKGLFHYFKELDTNKIFYVWSLSKLTFISKFKHNMNLCHCQKYLEDSYMRKFQRIDSFHSLKDASLRAK